MNSDFHFPEGFFWGASTSAHQVEGGNTNQWSEWEQKNAERLAQEAAQQFSFLTGKLRQASANPQNYISGKAADHFNRFREDFDLMQALGMNAYRFSIEWSRIEPEEGKFDHAAIQHYRDMIRELRRRKIEPFITLWHWTVPLWFAAQGGFERRKNNYFFTRFVARVVSEFGSEVRFWLTLNEPDVYVTNSYLRGIWPPQLKKPFLAWRMRQNLIAAHRDAYLQIKEANPQAQVGIAHAIAFMEPANTSWINIAAAKLARWYGNEYFLNRIVNRQDFIGMNYYFRTRFDWRRRPREEMEQSDLGWELHPSGICNALQSLQKYRKPIYVTENGLADADDSHRSSYLEKAVQGVACALQSGVDVRGYLHWSLLDNFEWDKGFWPRFGLIAVDYDHDCKRTVRPSALKYAEMIRENRIKL